MSYSRKEYIPLPSFVPPSWFCVMGDCLSWWYSPELPRVMLSWFDYWNVQKMDRL